MTALEIAGRVIGVLAFGMAVLSLWQDMKARELKKAQKENTDGR